MQLKCLIKEKVKIIPKLCLFERDFIPSSGASSLFVCNGKPIFSVSLLKLRVKFCVGLKLKKTQTHTRLSSLTLKTHP